MTSLLLAFSHLCSWSFFADVIVRDGVSVILLRKSFSILVLIELCLLHYSLFVV